MLETPPILDTLDVFESDISYIEKKTFWVCGKLFFSYRKVLSLKTSKVSKNMVLDIWNLSIPNKDNELVEHGHARTDKDSAGHFVENAAIKTSKNANFDIWNLTISDSKRSTGTSLDVLDSREGQIGPQKRLNVDFDISPSDQEREDIAAGLTPEQARRAAEARVDTLEWLLGLETLTQEQAELLACFRRMDAALISSRGQIPYLDSLGIPRFPPDCEPKYRHWENGQTLLDTLLELGASDRAIDMRVTMERSPDDWRRWQEIKAKRRK
jgi:hypothetical protein